MKFTNNIMDLSNRIIRTLVIAGVFERTEYVYLKFDFHEQRMMIYRYETDVEILARIRKGIRDYEKLTGKFVIEDISNDALWFMIENIRDLYECLVFTCKGYGSQTKIVFD